ncbi:MAG: hypothetical protein CFH43_00663 [Proteobacteria bacterium]|nr:MAG: hypothetical protein CFH43_00663 [Pseudomonadota bacterium]
MKKLILALSMIALPLASYAEQPQIDDIIDGGLDKKIADILNNEIVVRSIQIQNKNYENLKQNDINDLDQEWRRQTKVENQPLISSLLNRPLSAYLTRIQAHSGGIFTEIFVMDNKGLNVGQSSMSSDFWQGDEDKWQKTYLKSANQKFIDAPEFNEKRDVWVVQYNIAITDNEGKNVGAATFELNLSELARKKGILKLVENKNE